MDKSSPYEHIVKKHEGFCAHAYQDTEGFWTIGYGRLIDERRGGGVSRVEAGLLLSNDLRAAEALGRNLFDDFDAFTIGRRQALVSMAFNLGPRGLSGFRKMRAAIQAGEWERAAQEALDSKWARQVPHRAAEIVELFRGA